MAHPKKSNKDQEATGKNPEKRKAAIEIKEQKSPAVRSHIFKTFKTIPKIYLDAIKTLSVDTKKSRRLFAQLNKHKASGIVRNVKPLADSVLIPSGKDTDVVVSKLGPPKNIKIHDGGGGRMPNAQVYLVFWGDKWANNPPSNPSLQDIYADISAILGSSYLYSAFQYKLGWNAGGASLSNAWIDKRGVPSYDFTMVDVNYEAWLMMTSGPISPDSDTIVCVIMEPGASPSEDLRGEHQWSIQPDCQQIPTMWVKYDTRERMSSTFSHELVETVTDPLGTGYRRSRPAILIGMRLAMYAKVLTAQ